MKGIRIALALCVLTFSYCKKPFEPELTSEQSNVLVAEGFINTGADSTIFKLSRTVQISKGTGLKKETGATLTVESDASGTYQLKEEVPGIYNNPGLNVSQSKKYRLRIRTADGRTYLSAFVEAKAAPLIDSVNYIIKDNGLQLYVNTHDDTQNTRYYRWDYREDWEFYAKYESKYYSDGKELLGRKTTDAIYHCWASRASSEILLNSSVKLTKDVVSLNPLLFIPADAEKIGIKYSIIVNQYALTKEAYEFWELLRKNNETLGSIFDAQPSQLTGNIKNVDNAAEPVIGYVSAGVSQKKTIFIDREKLPKLWKMKYPYDCELDSLLFYDPILKVNTVQQVLIPKLMTPVDLINVNGILIGYTGAGKECADCTFRGTLRKPLFWP